ncbi:MAG: hypothetical protein RL518_225 [Pseudomonadota bacterium]|jgi:hypothetical protein
MSSSNESTSDPEFSLFLLLCENHRVRIEEISTQLRAIIPSPAFVPHTTVYFGSGTPVGGLDALVERAGLTTPPLRVPIVDVQTENLFWRSLYITLAHLPQLNHLNGWLHSNIIPYGSYTLFPHLSLLYFDSATSAERDRCQRRATEMLREAHLDELLFDRIAAFQRHGPEDAWENVTGWREIYSATLTGLSDVTSVDQRMQYDGNRK